MKPLEFCKAGDFTYTIIACFNFDPLFFERLALPALRASGSQRILVLADPRVTAEMAERWRGQTLNLGRSYLLSTPAVAGGGAFHPKFMLRIGRMGGALWVGSGNVSAGGWGLNREVATQWSIGPDEPDTGGWLDMLLEAIRRWTIDDPLAQGMLRAIGERRWWPSGGRSPLIVQEPTSVSLAQQLASRWPGRRFDTLMAATGSTDRGGAQLAWAHSTFGVREAVVLTDPQWAAFDPRRLEASPVDVRIAVSPGNHAKFYWFDGPDGLAAVMGSANCSAAAWFGANVEAVVVYDRPDPAAFAGLLDAMSSHALPGDVLAIPDGTDGAESEPADEHVAGPRLLWARMESARGIIEVAIAPAPAAGASVVLEIDDVEVAMAQATDADGRFVADDPEPVDRLVRAGLTPFCRARITHGSRVVHSTMRWLDDVISLARTRSHRTVGGSVDDFHRCADAGAYHQMIRDVQHVTDALFEDGALFSDREPGASGGRDSTAAVATDIQMLDPAEMLAEPPDPSGGSGPTRGSTPTLGNPLLGVMEALFGRADMSDVDVIADDEADGGATAEAPNVTGARRAPQPDERARLARQIDQYLGRFEARDDDRPPELRAALRMSASALAQAAGYPLALSIVGQESGWVEATTAQRWVERVFALLFHHSPPGRSDMLPGLLTRARQRFVEQGRGRVFDEAIGDGTVWLTLAGALASLPAPEPGSIGAMHRLMAWSALWSERTLLAAAEPAQLRPLLGRLRVDRAREALRTEAPRAAQRMRRLDAWVERHGEAMVRAQGRNHRQRLAPGEPLWGPKAGWAVVLEASSSGKAQVHRYASGQEALIRMRKVYGSPWVAAESDPDLAGLLAETGIARPAEEAVNP